MSLGPHEIASGLALVLASAGLTAILILLLKPLLQRYALAAPNARSSHITPTPQGAGMAVVGVTLAVTSFAALSTGSDGAAFAAIFLATALLAGIGAADDIWNVSIALRLLLQVCAVLIVIAALPADLQLTGILPPWVERVLLGLIALWFVNLVNFMDGIDWMTVVEVVPITAALAILGAFGALPLQVTVVALALGGALLGFAPFNKPVARLFLGDVGSLPIGLLLSWLLILLAGSGNPAAAILLPLYYLADATITLIQRVCSGQPFWKPHREHFYQRAFDGGLSAAVIVARVFAVNVMLAVLAIATVLLPGAASKLVSLAAGAAVVTWLLASLAPKRAVTK